jgi:hypothetical protein
MRRYLIVAHKTLGGTALLDAVRERLGAGPSAFYIVVPITHPPDHIWTEGEVQARATTHLEAAIERLQGLGVDHVSGEVGDTNPVHAVHQVLDQDSEFDEIIVSTLPPGVSRWLKLDVPSRLRKEGTIPVVHVIGDAAPVHT